MTPQNKKILIGVTVAAAVAGIYYTFFSKSTSGPSGPDPTGNGTTTPAAFDAFKVATDLYNLMKTKGYASFLNPNERAGIIRILKNVTEAQFAQVIKKFGSLNYNLTFGDQSFLPFTTPEKHPLVVWLQTELGMDTEEYLTLQRKYPNYL